MTYPHLRQRWELNQTLRFLVCCSSSEPLLLKGQTPCLSAPLSILPCSRALKKIPPFLLPADFGLNSATLLYDPFESCERVDGGSTLAFLGGWLFARLFWLSPPQPGPGPLTACALFLEAWPRLDVFQDVMSKWGRKAWKMVTQSKMWILC